MCNVYVIFYYHLFIYSNNIIKYAGSIYQFIVAFIYIFIFVMFINFNVLWYMCLLTSIIVLSSVCVCVCVMWLFFVC